MTPWPAQQNQADPQGPGPAERLPTWGVFLSYFGPEITIHINIVFYMSLQSPIGAHVG
jgi:hypothetical protein